MNAIKVETVWALAIAAVVAPLVARPGTSEPEGGVLPPDEVHVFVDCEDCPHSAGPYFRPTVRLVVDSSALMPNLLPTHTAAFDALAAWIGDKAAVAAAFPIEGVALNGFFFVTSGNSRNGDRWVGTLEIVAGMSAV